MTDQRYEIWDEAELGELIAAEIRPIRPPDRLRQRLLESIAGGPEVPAPPPPAPLAGEVRTTQGRWRKTQYPGVTWKRLFIDRAAGLLTTLVRMEPGSRIRPHTHPRAEQCLVIEGDIHHDGQSYGPGDFIWAAEGSIDPGVVTTNGSLLLIVGSPDGEDL